MAERCCDYPFDDPVHQLGHGRCDKCGRAYETGNRINPPCPESHAGVVKMHWFIVGDLLAEAWAAEEKSV